MVQAIWGAGDHLRPPHPGFPSADHGRIGHIQRAVPGLRPSVAVSTAIWAGVMLTLGMLLGPRLAVLLNAHGWVYFIWGAIVVALIGGMYLRQRRASAGAAGRRRPDRPVESPSS